jgi:hypothetical protein
MHTDDAVRHEQGGSMKRLAFFNGIETTAQKVGGRWLVGGDVVESGSVLIAAQDWQGRWAWHKLIGCRLKFDDFMTDAEVNKQAMLAA